MFQFVIPAVPFIVKGSILASECIGAATAVNHARRRTFQAGVDSVTPTVDLTAGPRTRREMRLAAASANQTAKYIPAIAVGAAGVVVLPVNAVVGGSLIAGGAGLAVATYNRKHIVNGVRAGGRHLAETSRRARRAVVTAKAEVQAESTAMAEAMVNSTPVVEAPKAAGKHVYYSESPLFEVAGGSLLDIPTTPVVETVVQEPSTDDVRVLMTEMAEIMDRLKDAYPTVEHEVVAADAPDPVGEFVSEQTNQDWDEENDRDEEQEKTEFEVALALKVGALNEADFVKNARQATSTFINSLPRDTYSLNKGYTAFRTWLDASSLDGRIKSIARRQYSSQRDQRVQKAA